MPTSKTEYRNVLMEEVRNIQSLLRSKAINKGRLEKRKLLVLYFH